MSYRIDATADLVTIHCLKCGGSSSNPRDVRLRSCPKCGYHAVFPSPVGFGETTRRADLLGLRGSVGLPSGELVVGEAEEPEE